MTSILLYDKLESIMGHVFAQKLSLGLAVIDLGYFEVSTKTPGIEFVWFLLSLLALLAISLFVMRRRRPKDPFFIASTAHHPSHTPQD